MYIPVLRFLEAELAAQWSAPCIRGRWRSRRRWTWRRPERKPNASSAPSATSARCRSGIERRHATKSAL